MTNDLSPSIDSDSPQRKHPDAKTIEDVLTFKLNRLVAINEREGHRWSKDLFGLSLNEWRVLALIQAHAPIRAGDVAALLLMDKSQLSRLIKELQVQRLIMNKPDTHDARAVVLSLTPKGTVLYNNMLTEVLRQNELVLAPLSADEVQQFDDMLNRLTIHNLSMLQEPLQLR